VDLVSQLDALLSYWRELILSWDNSLSLYGTSTRGSRVCLYSPKEVPCAVRPNRPNTRFRLLLIGGGRMFQKLDRDGPRGRPINLIMGPVGLWWWGCRSNFDRCVRVIVLFPKSYNTHQTESGWGSYARFTEPCSATDIFWFWTPNMANDISVSIISTSSSQCCTLIIHLRYF
jgi:hypothetical protein